MQLAGKLPFVRDEHGVCRFSRKEIEQMAAAASKKDPYEGIAPGPVTAKACALFAQGRTWKEVVIVLGELGMGQPIEVVRAIHRQWSEREGPAARANTPATCDAEEGGDNDRHADELERWQREQDAARQRAQKAFDDEQRAWDEERRRSSPAVLHPPRPAARASSLAVEHDQEDAPPISERIAVLLQAIAGTGSR